MRSVCQWFALVFLLLTAQAGALSHELEHLARSDHSEAQLGSGGGGLADTVCARCPAYAQVVTAAVSPVFAMPSFLRCEFERSAEPTNAPIDARVPTPRSRGPPSLI
jgi:hypothetical protein